MAVNLNTVPNLSPFQRAHVGTTQTGLSGILPFNKRIISPALFPNLTVPSTAPHVIGSTFHLFKWRSSPLG